MPMNSRGAVTLGMRRKTVVIRQLMLNRTSLMQQFPPYTDFEERIGLDRGSF